MDNNKNGKYRALFGVLLVFIIPFILITGVYLSPKPKHKTLPNVVEQPVNFKVSEFGDKDFLTNFDEDIKLVIDTTKGSISDLDSLYKKTLEYPERTFKEPHSKILFIYRDSGVTGKHELSLSKQRLLEIFSENNKFNNNILLLDRNDRIRGEYDFTTESIEVLNLDIQYLMVETLAKNSESKRVFK